MTTGRANESTTLLDLAARLAQEVGQFVDQRLALFKAELKEEAAQTVRSLGLLAAGAVGAGTGTMFLLLALGLWVGDLVGSRAGGMAIVGGGLALIGGGLALLATRKLGRRRLVRGHGRRPAKGRAMDPERSVDSERLRRDIDATRASITRTAGELRRKVGETMQWQTYVERYPAPVFVGAALVGLLVGRRLARGFAGNGAGVDAGRRWHGVPRPQFHAVRDRPGRPPGSGARLVAAARFPRRDAREPSDRRNGGRRRAGHRARTGRRRTSPPGRSPGAAGRADLRAGDPTTSS